MNGSKAKELRGKLDRKLKQENVKLHNENEYLKQMIKNKDNIIEMQTKEIEKLMPEVKAVKKEVKK